MKDEDDEMIVAVIRHAKVDMKWKPFMTSVEYDKGCADYDAAPVLPVTVNLPPIAFQKIYVSTLPRTTATARQVVGERKFHATSLINEVAERSGFDSELKLPVLVWSVVSRIQWFANMRRQPETRTQTRRRAEKFARHLIRQNEDCVVFTHGFFMVTLMQELKKRGFRLDHERLFYANGEVVICKRSIHDQNSDF